MTVAQTTPQANGAGPTSALADAIESERQIAWEAEQIRGDQTTIDRRLFLKLWPLLRRPIPPGFIQHVGTVSGKPYESDGVSSVQVQIERMDAVLTPFGWWDEVTWLAESLAEVTVHVGDAESRSSFFSRTARGGVKQPNPANTAKGTYTNAAKLAFARVGPGHEVYLGAADFDPDTDESAAEAQAEGGRGGSGTTEPRKLTTEEAERLEKVVNGAGLDQHWQMRLRGFGVAQTSDLTTEQATKAYEWATGGQDA